MKSKKIRSEKGSITVFVVVTMLFFLYILNSIYMSQSNKVNTQKKQIKLIQQEYNKDENMDEIYNNLIKTENYADAE